MTLIDNRNGHSHLEKPLLYLCVLGDLCFEKGFGPDLNRTAMDVGEELPVGAGVRPRYGASTMARHIAVEPPLPQEISGCTC